MPGSYPSETYLREELVALEEEGFDTSEARQKLDRIAGRGEAGAERQVLLDGLAALPRRPGFGYVEPSDLGGIRAARPEQPSGYPRKMSKQSLADRTLGAWLGRSAGCLLGKPCEGWHRQQIEKALRAVNAWPLSDYWPVVRDLPEGFFYRSRGSGGEEGIPYPSPGDASLKENIKQMTRDDDMDYPIIGLHILESHGAGFTTRDVGNAWLARLPYHCVYTAERVAYRNLVNGLQPPDTATCQNPYREWIGAQIRADIWGWAAPGNPELAAELAWRDAALSHTKNGIYGEMFFAALLAAAFVESDLHELIEIGLSQVPAQCRLREAILDTVKWCAEDAAWETTWEKLNTKYGHYHGVHTINNAAVVVMGLLHSGGEYERAIAIAVMGGWDTDCNGATAGSVMGTILGAKGLPAQWIAPLRDRISSIVVGFTEMRISELARRTRALQKPTAS